MKIVLMFCVLFLFCSNSESDSKTEPIPPAVQITYDTVTIVQISSSYENTCIRVSTGPNTYILSKYVEAIIKIGDTIEFRNDTAYLKGTELKFTKAKN